MMTDSRFIAMPKIELHCHLDGGMDLSLAEEILRTQGETTDAAELLERMQVTSREAGLAEYLARFDLPIRLLQSEYALSEQAYRLARSCAAENVKYLEVRFAPTSHRKEGLSVKETVLAVSAGLKRAEAEVDIKTGLILCVMRHLPEETNRKVLLTAKELLPEVVAGFDLAGDEKAYPLSLCRNLFAEAKALSVPFTIHAGETAESRENVREAAQLGAARVGHGIDMRYDEELMRLCAGNRIGAELCPTSNLQTGGIAALSEFPLRTFLSRGVPVSVNTDNRTISGIDLTQEYELLDREFSLTDEELKQIYMDSVEMAFTDDATKERLRKQWIRQ